MYPLLQHPNRFVWDFWYHYDTKDRLFHILYLNADPCLVASQQHHFSARIGYAVTQDFTKIDWRSDNVFQASEYSWDKYRWDNTSIWSGDMIKVRDGLLFYYTSRDQYVDDGMTQNIGLAFSTDYLHWERVPSLRLRPDPRFYEPQSVQGDNTIHAWRDPFLFRASGEIYMLVSAKDPQQLIGRKGCIGLLRAINQSLTKWTALPPTYSPGWYSECEVPQLYHKNGQYLLTFSCAAKYDQSPYTLGQGGLVGVVGTSSRIEEPFSEPAHVLLAEASGLYACRVIPELDGDIVGFDLQKGGWRRVPARTKLRSIDRDFSQTGLTDE
ncbi:MAG: beta-fructosidase [Promethearchaeota archaeon]